MPNTHNTMPQPPNASQARGTKPAFENEGEGSRSAARNYDKATEQYVKSGRVDEAAKEAEKALEGPEGDELRDAELATRATMPDTKVNPPKDEDDSFQEDEMMKDETEDRE
jgi:hypothetical protein